MWRAFFLGVGISLVILGAESLIVERAMLAETASRILESAELTGERIVNQSRVFNRPDWVPWSLLSAGILTILYSFSLPRRFASAA